MTDVPMHPMFWGDFFSDPRVAAMPAETQGIYALLLGRMWMNGGWLANDDATIARLLGLTRIQWSRRHRPHIEPLLISKEFSGIFGGLLTQRRVERDWQKVGKTIARTSASLAKARAEKAAKAKQRASAADPFHGFEPDDVAALEAQRATGAEPRSNHNHIEGPGSGQSNGQATPAPSPTVDDGSLRPFSNTPLIDAIKAQRAERAKAAAGGTSIFDRLKQREDGNG